MYVGVFFVFDGGAYYAVTAAWAKVFNTKDTKEAQSSQRLFFVGFVPPLCPLWFKVLVAAKGCYSLLRVSA